MRLAYRGVLCALFFACSGPFDAIPPPLPDAGPTATQTAVTFALDSVQLGDSTNGVLDTTAWRAIGFDLDGKITTKHSSNVCTFGPTFIREDGIGGRDNSFADNIIPIVETMRGPFCLNLFGSDTCPDAGPPRVLSSDETAAIASGRFTLQIRVVGLNGDATQTATGLSAQVFTSDAFDPDGGAAPTFDTTTSWPVQPDSLNDHATLASGAKAAFTSAYVSNGTFVAGTNEHVTVPFHAQIDNFAFTLQIHSAIVVFDVRGGAALNGVLAGVIDPNELIPIFKRQASVISQSLCGSAFDGIEQQIRQAVEIMLDRSNNEGTVCSGISFGMGFTAKQIGDPAVVAAPAALPSDPCDAGGDSSDAADAGAD